MRKFVRIAADVDAGARLAREPVHEHADVGRGAADVGDQRVSAAGQVGGAADAVGRAAADRQHRVAQRRSRASISVPSFCAKKITGSDAVRLEGRRRTARGDLGADR